MFSSIFQEKLNGVFVFLLELQVAPALGVLDYFAMVLSLALFLRSMFEAFQFDLSFRKFRRVGQLRLDCQFRSAREVPCLLFDGLSGKPVARRAGGRRLKRWSLSGISFSRGSRIAPA